MNKLRHIALFAAALLSGLSAFGQRLPDTTVNWETEVVTAADGTARIVFTGTPVVPLDEIHGTLQWISCVGENCHSPEELEYDLMQRKGQWEQIIQKSDHCFPQSLACQYIARMAKHQTGRIGDGDMFSDLALSNNAMSSMTSAYMMSDVYMYAGLVNLAQRASFEAMASIEDFSMSGRALQRLTETALITGQYRVARKYISILDKTVYYHDFAKRMKVMADDPSLIDHHPIYGSLRKAYEHTKDVLFD